MKAIPYALYDKLAKDETTDHDVTFTERAEQYTVDAPVSASSFDRKPVVGAFAIRVRTLLGRGSV